MTSVRVIRAPANIVGVDIVDPLLTTDAVAIQRGRNEIDAASKITPTTLTIIHRDGLETGQTVEVMDSLQGRTWYGKIVGIDIALEFSKLTTTLSVERV